MPHSPTCTGCPECSAEMQAILRMDSAQLSRLTTARTEQHMRAIGQNPNTPRQMRTSATTCSCGKHVAKAAPVAAALSPAEQRVRALDIYTALLEHATPTNLKAARLIEMAFPGIGEEYMLQSAPAMPTMTDALRTNAQRQTADRATATVRSLSNMPKPVAPQRDVPAAYAPVKVATMTERILANRKKK